MAFAPLSDTRCPIRHARHRREGRREQRTRPRSATRNWRLVNPPGWRSPHCPHHRHEGRCAPLSLRLGVRLPRRWFFFALTYMRRTPSHTAATVRRLPTKTAAVDLIQLILRSCRVRLSSAKQPRCCRGCPGRTRCWHRWQEPGFRILCIQAAPRAADLSPKDKSGHRRRSHALPFRATSGRRRAPNQVEPRPQRGGSRQVECPSGQPPDGPMARAGIRVQMTRVNAKAVSPPARRSLPPRPASRRSRSLSTP